MKRCVRDQQKKKITIIRVINEFLNFISTNFLQLLISNFTFPTVCNLFAGVFSFFIQTPCRPAWRIANHVFKKQLLLDFSRVGWQVLKKLSLWSSPQNSVSMEHLLSENGYVLVKIGGVLSKTLSTGKKIIVVKLKLVGRSLVHCSLLWFF